MRDDYEENYKNHSLKKTAILLVVLMILAVASFFVAVKVLGKSEKKTVKNNKPQVEEAAAKKEEETKKAADAQEEAKAASEKAKIDASNYTVDQLYYEVHLKANTLIVAEDNQIWEETSIDKEFLNYTIELVKDKDPDLYNMLLPWKSLDFSNAVDVHNYVWEKLGGTVGKAVGLNDDAINKLKQTLAQ